MRSRTQLRKDAWKNRQKRTADEGHRYLGGNRTGIQSAAAHPGKQRDRLQNLRSHTVAYSSGDDVVELLLKSDHCVGARSTSDDSKRAERL